MTPRSFLFFFFFLYLPSLLIKYCVYKICNLKKYSINFVIFLYIFCMVLCYHIFLLLKKTPFLGTLSLTDLWDLGHTRIKFCLGM